MSRRPSLSLCQRPGGAKRPAEGAAHARRAAQADRIAREIESGNMHSEIEGKLEGEDDEEAPLASDFRGAAPAAPRILFLGQNLVEI